MGREMITHSQMRRKWTRLASRGCKVMWARDFVNNKTRVKRAHLKHMHMNKDGSTGQRYGEGSTGQHYGESSHTSSGVSAGVCSFISGWSGVTWGTQASICGSVMVLTLIASDTGPIPPMAGRSSAKLGTHDMEGMVLLQLCQALQVGHGIADHDGPRWSCWLLALLEEEQGVAEDLGSVCDH